ncbi:hypothetical protein Bbelb_336030 [Branchiostoma belcheri]|nr:hypothetical protein Bbelb_336030 [Branchiostoma belcheri]
MPFPTDWAFHDELIDGSIEGLVSDDCGRDKASKTRGKQETNCGKIGGKDSGGSGRERGAHAWCQCEYIIWLVVNSPIYYYLSCTSGSEFLPTCPPACPDLGSIVLLTSGPLRRGSELPGNHV